jgi:hypothetical protein
LESSRDSRRRNFRFASVDVTENCNRAVSSRLYYNYNNIIINFIIHHTCIKINRCTYKYWDMYNFFGSPVALRHRNKDPAPFRHPVDVDMYNFYNIFTIFIHVCMTTILCCKYYG